MEGSSCDPIGLPTANLRRWYWMNCRKAKRTDVELVDSLGSSSAWLLVLGECHGLQRRLLAWCHGHVLEPCASTFCLGWCPPLAPSRPPSQRCVGRQGLHGQALGGRVQGRGLDLPRQPAATCSGPRSGESPASAGAARKAWSLMPEKAMVSRWAFSFSKSSVRLRSTKQVAATARLCVLLQT